jgi:hypothetical protein
MEVLNMGAAAILLLIAQITNLATAVEPDVLALIKLLRSSADTFESDLAEADKIEQAEIEKLKGEITPPAPAS